VYPPSGPDRLSGWRGLAPCAGRDEVVCVTEDGTEVLRDVVADLRVRSISRPQTSESNSIAVSGKPTFEQSQGKQGWGNRKKARPPREGRPGFVYDYHGVPATCRLPPHSTARDRRRRVKIIQMQGEVK
jgi:hypothetical protein